MNVVVLCCMGDGVHREGDRLWCKKRLSSLCGHWETHVPGDWRVVRWRLEKQRKDTGQTTELSGAGWSSSPVLRCLNVLIDVDLSTTAV